MLKNNNICAKLVESIDTVHEAMYEIYGAAYKQDYITLSSLIDLANQLLHEIHNTMKLLYSEDEIIKNINYSIVENAVESLNNITLLSKVRSYKLLDKIQYESLPIIKLLYFVFYFIAFAEGDKKKTEEFINGLGYELFVSDAMKESLVSGNYKYDVSIAVVAFNKLEYTKKCIDSIVKNTPAHINYELILINHGSTDGTKEYFESVGCTKQIDLAHNGLARIKLYAIEGKYLCTISNDIVVGEGYLDNMLSCFQNDASIKYVVPTTPNISNLQNIPCDFENLEQIQQFAKRNNVSDPFRWEQRSRLINPIAVHDCEFFFKNNIFLKNRLRLRENAFGDDYISLLVRRLGGKNVLAKDSFCYHFGNVTLKEDKLYNSNDNFINGRVAFKKLTGIDPWGIGFCYDYNLINALPCKDVDEVNILGINCGLGSNPLKIKEKIKEEIHNTNVKIYNLTTDPAFLSDLKGVSNFVKIYYNFNDIKLQFPGIKFDYIICESLCDKYPLNLFTNILKSKLKKNGMICILDRIISKSFSVDSLLYPGKKWYITNHNYREENL